MANESVIDIKVISTTNEAEAGLSRVGHAAESNLGVGGKAGKAAKEHETAMDRASSSTKKVEGAATSASSGLKSMAEGFAAATIVEEVSRDFEKTQSAVNGLNQAMANAGQKETPQFTAALKNTQEAARDLGFSTGDATGSVGQLVQAGVSWQEAMGAQVQIMDLARAKNISLADATTAVIMGMQGSGKALKALNVEMPPHIATQAKLDAANQKVTDSTDKVQRAQEKYTEVVKKHGANSDAARTAMQSLKDAQNNLTDAQAKAADTQKSFSDRTGNLSSILGTLDGKVGGQAQAHTKDMAVQWDILKEKFNEVGGQVIQGVLMPVLGVLMGALGKLADHANIVVPAIVAMTVAFIAFKVAGAISAVISGVSAAISVLGGALDILAANPIILVIAAIVAILVLLQTKFHFVEAIVKALGPTFQQVGKVVGDVMHGIGGVVGTVAGAIGAAIKTIAPVVEGVFKVAATIVGTYISIWVNVIKTAIGVISGVIGVVATVVGAVFGTAATIVGGVFSAISTVIKTYIGIWGAIIGTIVGVVQAIARGIGSAFQGAHDVISGIFKGIGAIVHDILSVPVGLVNAIIGFIDDKIQIHIPAVGVGPVHTPAFDWDGLKIPKLKFAGGSGFNYFGPQGLSAQIFDNPHGERIQTAQQAQQEMIAAMTIGAAASQVGGHKSETHVKVLAQTNADPHQISRAVVWGLRQRRAA